MRTVSRVQTTGSKALIEFLRDQKENFRWRITARNGEILGESSEGFSSAQACKNNLKLLAGVLLELQAEAIENVE
jgi:uncharacterized protein YegP (UPF0339 family)